MRRRERRRVSRRDRPPSPRADVKAFRRNVEDVCRRWQRTVNFSEFSIGRLILESVSRGVVHRMYFPVEIVLMVKAPTPVAEGLRVLESITRRPPQNPSTGIRGTILAGFALVAGAVVLGFGDPWPLWAALFALVLAFRRA